MALRIGLSSSKQFEFCSGGSVYCMRTHPQHTTVHSGSVSICGLSVAVERDDTQAHGWLADVTTSVRGQDGGDRMRTFPPTIHTTEVELSCWTYRVARDLNCGEFHLWCIAPLLPREGARAPRLSNPVTLLLCKEPRSGSVSIRGLPVAAERDKPQALGWFADVATSVRRQDGGDGMRPFLPTTQTAAAELSRAEHRLARDSSNGKPHPTVFFATPAERGCQTSSSRQFGDPSSSASATESQCIVDSGSRLRRACALSDCRRSGHSGGSSIVSQPTHSLSELWEGLQPLAKGTSNHRERLQAPTLISPTSHPSHPLFSSGRRLEVDSPRRDCRSPPQGCDRASAQGTKHARLLLEVLCREEEGGGHETDPRPERAERASQEGRFQIARLSVPAQDCAMGTGFRA